MNIGIYTIHATNNFGALLQSYATAKFLNSHGHHAEIVNLYTINDEKHVCYVNSWTSPKGFVLNLMRLALPSVRRKLTNYQKFRQMLPLSIRFFSASSLRETPPEYDLHLVGSDQVWNTERELSTAAIYFLDFLVHGEHKASYASSFGNVEAANRYVSEIKGWLSEYQSVSVREVDAVSFLREKCEVDAKLVLDPTFLLSAEEWSDISGEKLLIPGKYVLYYGFDKTQMGQQIIDTVRREYNMPVIGISVSLTSPYRFDRFYQQAAPLECLNLIRNAEMVLTSSFHGAALSVNFRKDFIVIRHGSRMSRLESMLDLFGIKDRIVSNVDDTQQILSSSRHIDYSLCESFIDSAVNDSKQWLLNVCK